ncbi:MAG: hypothetical protein QM504_10145 [Pseudomonadota bacterium]
MHDKEFKQPIDFCVLCYRIGVTAPYLVELFKVNKRTVQYWFKGRYGKPSKPPQAIYNAIFNLNNSFFELAKMVANDKDVKYITTYHDESSLREEFPDCYFGIDSHRAFVGIVLGFNPSIKTTPSVIDFNSQPDWGEIANVAPQINVEDLKNIAIFKPKH